LLINITKICLPLLLVISMNCFSQDKETAGIVDVTKATFLDPGISYEKAIGKLQSLYGQAFMSTSFSVGYSSALGTTTSLGFDPALTVQYRYYYNYARRQQKGKRTEMNSLNYIGPAIGTVFSKNRISASDYPETSRRPINTIGLVWGFQRNYEKRFSLDLNLGFGYLFTTATTRGPADEPIKKHVGQFSTLGQLNLGFWLNKRK
jgi:hypothetical protein